VEAKALEDVLPAPRVRAAGNDLSRSTLPYATALAGACPRLAPAANLLPRELRVSTSRSLYAPTIVSATLLLAAAGALAAQSAIQDRRYLRKLEEEIARLEPAARRSAALDGEIERAQLRSAGLENFRARPRQDLETLNEVTRLLPPPIWANTIDVSPDSVSIAGEAEQAAQLVQVLDSSPLFQNSEVNMLARTGSSEIFRITTRREAKK
jgi:Tfp pilus assembly protein PilN